MEPSFYEKIVWQGGIRPPQNSKRPLTFIGIDSETLRDGSSFLWCDSDGRFCEYPDADTLLGFLLQKPHQGHNLVAFNLGFELDGLLRLLPKRCVIDIFNDNTTTYGDYTIKAFSKKLLYIRRGHKNVRITDIQPFYQSSLSTASKKYLGEDKIHETLNLIRANISREVAERDRDEYITYCTDDALKTQQLAVLMAARLAETGIKPATLISPANVAERYFHHHCTNIPLANYCYQRPKICKVACEAYWGGRFELWKRGYLQDIHAYDITSAYPAQMRNLPDLTTGHWTHTRIDDPSCDFGFARIEGMTEIPLLVEQRNGFPLRYPIGIISPRWVTLDEYRFLRDNGQDIELSQAWLYHHNKDTFPMRDAINKLFADRIDAIDAGDDERSQVIKLYLNSMSGKFTQKVKKKEGFSVGKSFNPIWASHITARTRIELLKYALKSESSIIGFATDCIYSLEQLDLPVSATKILGTWEEKKWEEGLFLQNGVYTLRNPDKLKMGSRGFGSREFAIDLFKEALEYPKVRTIQYTQERPYHAREAVHERTLKDLGTMTMSNINQFIPVKKSLDINQELKRIWTDQFHNLKDASTRHIDSIPYCIETIK